MAGRARRFMSTRGCASRRTAGPKVWSDTRKGGEFQNPLTWAGRIQRMAAGHLNRSKERNCNVAFRLSREDRELLQQRAADEGLSVQAYLERVALGRADASDREPGRPRRLPAQEALPLPQSA